MSVRIGGSVLALALVLGCAGGKTTGTGGVSPASAPVTLASVTGDYALVAVDGHALPYAPRVSSGTARSVVSGTLQVNTNGTFKLTTTYASESGGNSAAFSGACYPEGNEVKMVWDDGASTMALRGDTVVVRRDGTVYAYLRGR